MHRGGGGEGGGGVGKCIVVDAEAEECVGPRRRKSWLSLAVLLTSCAIFTSVSRLDHINGPC